MGKVTEPIILSDITVAGENVLKKIARIQLAPQSVQQTVISLATLVEVHVSGLLATLVDQEQEGRSLFEEAMLERVEMDLYSNRKSTFKWLNDGFGIKLPETLAFQQFNDCVGLRNLIVHGDSQLTRIQTRKFVPSIALRGQLERSLGVTFSGNHVSMGDDTSKKSIQISRNFIIDFDKVVLGFYPRLAMYGEHQSSFGE